MKTVYNNIKAVIAFTLFVSLLAGCELDRAPKGSLNSDNFWKTEADATRALMGCYSYLDASVYDAYQDAYADIAYAQYQWESSATSIGAGDITDDLDAGYGFRGIRRFNYFLENISKVTMNEELKKQYIAEVRVLRAWRYYNLASTFGAVPLFKKYISDVEEAKVAPTPEAEVMAFVTKEIDEAIASLPQGGVKSRITKDAALNLKARIHLFNKQWQQAQAASEQIMASKKYKLYTAQATASEIASDDYSSLVTFTNDADKQAFYNGIKSYETQFWVNNESNSEVILNAEHITDNYNYISLYFLSDNTGGGWSSITPTLALVEKYPMRDGTAFVAPSVEARSKAYEKYKKNDKAEFLKEFSNRDPRLYASILFPGAISTAIMGQGEHFDWKKGASNTSRTGFNFRKMTEPTGGIYQKLNDFPLMRYAEVLLNFAEAKNEATGPSADIYNALDEIRSRAGVGKVDRTKYASQETLRELIHNERCIELAGEGLRWKDIRRWGIAKDVMKTAIAIDGGKAQERKWEDRFMRLPYPIKAIDLNPNLKEAQQAKGY